MPHPRAVAIPALAAAQIERGEPVTVPGVPKNYPDTKGLATANCIRPSVAS